MNNTVFGRTIENVRKYRNLENIETCHNTKKQKLFDVRTKFSYYKVFDTISVSNRNVKKCRYL